MPACGEVNEDEAKKNGKINVQLLSLHGKGLGAVPDAFGGIATDYLCNLLLHTKLCLCAPMCSHCKGDLLENLVLLKNNSSTCHLFQLLQFVCV